ncbi:MAG TPA: glycosyltransferase [Acidimicrobiia bacterium]|nr:glycosyltransferase [Acidimicrobiia bacterium]
MSTFTLSFDHLDRLTGPHGLYEHALLDVPRTAHGYTLDDNARAVALLARADMTGSEHFSLYLGLVLAGRTGDGWHNRMSARGRWVDRVGPDDTIGRVFWALGETIRAGVSVSGIEGQMTAISRFESIHVRANSYALLGAVAALDAGFMVEDMTEFIARAAHFTERASTASWPWPEPALTYANARIPQAMILTGHALASDDLTQRGLSLLDWLVDIETGENGFSFTPVGGRRPGEVGPSFDQQPIEAWAMADACAAAYRVTGASRWRQGVIDAAMWFHGRNDVGVRLFDPVTGAGFDGLHRSGVNQNRGAESTLAALAAQLRLAEVS